MMYVLCNRPPQIFGKKFAKPYKTCDTNQTIYDNGATVQNRFGGDSIELNALELSIYDAIMGCEMIEDYENVRLGLVLHPLLLQSPNHRQHSISKEEGFIHSKDFLYLYQYRWSSVSYMILVPG